MSRFEFEFDFDHWRALAEKDPAAFFVAREAILARFIEMAPTRLNGELHALQDMIDYSRAEAGTPTKATHQLMGMLGEHLAALSGHMVQLREQSCALAALLPPVEGD